MKVQCKNCGSVYNLNEKKIPKRKVKFRCRQCQEFVYLNVANVPPKSQLKDQIKECPKCGFSLSPGAIECPNCNIILEKYKSYIEKKQAENMQNESDAAEGQ